MHRLLVSCLLLVTCLGPFAQGGRPVASPTVRKLLSEPGGAGAFWSAYQGKAPLVEAIQGKPDRVLVTYFFRGTEKTKGVDLMGAAQSFSIPDRLQPIPGTDLWYATQTVPHDSRYTYGFLEHRQGEETRPIPDPNNPLSNNFSSRVELPNAAKETWSLPREGSPKGSLIEKSLKSAVLAEERPIHVYTPAGYRKGAGYRLVIAFDAEGYGLGPNPVLPLPRILDNLQADKKIPPTVAVLINYVSQDKRMRDLGCSELFARFVAEELLPYMQREFGAGVRSNEVVITGSSLGGLQALFVGLRHGNRIGNVLAQSPSLWFFPEHLQGPPDFTTEFGWLNREFAKASPAKARYYIEMGLFEQGPLGNPLTIARGMRDLLTAKSFPLKYKEFSGGHSYQEWRTNIGDALIWLLNK